LHTHFPRETAKVFNNGIKFVSESEVDPLSIEKALSSDSDNDSDIDEVPLNKLKKKKERQKISIRHFEMQSLVFLLLLFKNYECT